MSARRNQREAQYGEQLVVRLSAEEAAWLAAEAARAGVSVSAVVRGLIGRQPVIETRYADATTPAGPAPAGLGRRHRRTWRWPGSNSWARRATSRCSGGCIKPATTGAHGRPGGPHWLGWQRSQRTWRACWHGCAARLGHGRRGDER